MAGISGTVRLRRAIERNQLRLEYQPKADMRTGRIVGAEALVRWAAPRRGLILPDHFIPRAERNAKTLESLTGWTVNAAFAQARALGCGSSQGYFFTAPGPAATMSELLAAAI